MFSFISVPVTPFCLNDHLFLQVLSVISNQDKGVNGSTIHFKKKFFDVSVLDSIRIFLFEYLLVD